MKKITGMNKKYKWMLLLASLFLVVAGMFAYARKDKTYAADPYYLIKDSEGNTVDDSYTMRRSNDTFIIDTDDSSVVSYEWTIANTNVVEVVNGSSSTEGTGKQVDLHVKKPGSVMLRVLLKDSAGNTIKTMTPSISVAFSINEYIDPNSGAQMVRIFDDDERKSLVMLYNKPIELGKDASSEPGKLNLNYGAADDERTTWTSSNKDVVDINTTTKTVSPIGAGHATLTVSYTESDHEYHDTINVYVRPQIKDGNNTIINYDLEDYGGYFETVNMRNNDLLNVSVNFGTNPLEAISDKLVWVITKGEGENEVLVRDSKGNYTEECKDEARLIWQPGSKSYRLNAKAGTYHISFYVAGTYNSYDEAKKRVPGCKPDRKSVV